VYAAWSGGEVGSGGPPLTPTGNIAGGGAAFFFVGNAGARGGWEVLASPRTAAIAQNLVCHACARGP